MPVATFLEVRDVVATPSQALVGGRRQTITSLLANRRERIQIQCLLCRGPNKTAKRIVGVHRSRVPPQLMSPEIKRAMEAPETDQVQTIPRTRRSNGRMTGA